MKNIVFFAACVAVLLGLMAYASPKEFAMIDENPDTITAGELIRELRKYDPRTPVYRVRDWNRPDYRGRIGGDNLDSLRVSEQRRDGYIEILL